MWAAPESRPDLVALDGLGAFVRSLLPVHLIGGDSVTFGVWLAVDEDTWHRVVDQWWAPSYASLTFDGRLASDVPPWREIIAGAPAHALVMDPSQIPYIVSSENEALSAVLKDEWPEERIAPALEAFWQGTG